MCRSWRRYRLTVPCGKWGGIQVDRGRRRGHGGFRRPKGGGGGGYGGRIGRLGGGRQRVVEAKGPDCELDARSSKVRLKAHGDMTLAQTQKLTQACFKFLFWIFLDGSKGTGSFLFCKVCGGKRKEKIQIAGDITFKSPRFRFALSISSRSPAWLPVFHQPDGGLSSKPRRLAPTCLTSRSV